MRRAALILSLAACGGGSDTKTVDAAKAVDAACVKGADGCLDPCALGNDKGVGKYCTPGGGECNANSGVGGFIFCTKDYEPAENIQYCTGPCQTDADCGTGAYCSGSGSGSKGCEPATCGGMPSTDAGV